jgi:hypothetical protein
MGTQNGTQRVLKRVLAAAAKVCAAPQRVGCVVWRCRVLKWYYKGTPHMVLTRYSDGKVHHATHAALLRVLVAASVGCSGECTAVRDTQACVCWDGSSPALTRYSQCTARYRWGTWVLLRHSHGTAAPLLEFGLYYTARVVAAMSSNNAQCVTSTTGGRLLCGGFARRGTLALLIGYSTGRSRRTEYRPLATARSLQRLLYGAVRSDCTRPHSHGCTCTSTHTCTGTRRTLGALSGRLWVLKGYPRAMEACSWGTRGVLEG